MAEEGKVRRLSGRCRPGCPCRGHHGTRGSRTLRARRRQQGLRIDQSGRSRDFRQSGLLMPSRLRALGDRHGRGAWADLLGRGGCGDRDGLLPSRGCIQSLQTLGLGRQCPALLGRQGLVGLPAVQTLGSRQVLGGAEVDSRKRALLGGECNPFAHPCVHPTAFVLTQGRESLGNLQPFPLAGAIECVPDPLERAQGLALRGVELAPARAFLCHGSWPGGRRTTLRHRLGTHSASQTEPRENSRTPGRRQGEGAPNRHSRGALRNSTKPGSA